MSGKLNGSTASVARELRRAGDALSRCADLLEGTDEHADDASSEVGGPLLTARQLGAIRVISKKAGLSRDQLTRLIRQATGKDEMTRLNKNEASALIDHLSGMNGAS